MSRRGNCYDNAVAESFFSVVKTRRIKKKIYSNRSETRTDIFEYIEMFYNSKRRRGSNDRSSTLEYEKANKRLTFKIIKVGAGVFKVDVYKLGKKVHTGKKTFPSLLEAKFQLHSYIKNKEYKERFDRTN